MQLSSTLNWHEKHVDNSVDEHIGVTGVSSRNGVCAAHACTSIMRMCNASIQIRDLVCVLYSLMPVRGNVTFKKIYKKLRLMFTFSTFRVVFYMRQAYNQDRLMCSSCAIIRSILIAKQA